MKKIIIIIFSALPLLAFTPKDSVSVEDLKEQAFNALKKYNEAKEESEFKIADLIASFAVAATIAGLFISYRANEISKKANKIAKRN